MKNIISFLIVSFLIFGCKKGQKILPDDIESHQLEPVVEFSSIDSLYFASTIYPNVPTVLPHDSIVTREVDVDLDGTSDVVIRMSHGYAFVSTLNPGSGFRISISATGINGAKLSQKKEKGSILHEYLNWDSYSSLMGYAGNSLYDFSDSTYVPIRIKNGVDYNYGWVLLTKENNKITIHKTAINRTNNNSIITGIE